MKKTLMFMLILTMLVACRNLDDKTYLVVTYDHPKKGIITQVLDTYCYYDEYNQAGMIWLFSRLERKRPKLSPPFFEYGEVQLMGCRHDTASIRDEYGDRVVFIKAKILKVFKN